MEDYSTKVTTTKSVLTLLLLVGAVNCSPLPSNLSSRLTNTPITHLEPLVHSTEVSHEVRHITSEVNEHDLDPSKPSVEDATDSTLEQEPSLPSDNPTPPHSITHLGFTPTGVIDALHHVYAHATPPKIIEAKENVQDKKQDKEIAVAAALTHEPTFISDSTTSNHDAEEDSDFPKPEGEPEEEYIGLEPNEPLKDIADQISIISQPLQDYVDQAKNIWEPIQDDISTNFDDTVKSISDATNEAKKILDPIQDDISKNIEETIKSISEASEDIVKDEEPNNLEANSFDEHISSADESIKNANYIKIADEPIVSGEQNIFSATKFETNIDENINEDFEIIGDKAEPIESDYELIDDAVEFIKDGAQSITAAAKEGFDNAMSAAMKVDPSFDTNINLYEEFGETYEADIVNKDENISEHTLEADYLVSEILQNDFHNEAMSTEDTTETPVLFEDFPQADQPALDVDQDQNHELEEETIKYFPKDIVEEESLTEELPQADQLIDAKDQEENDMLINPVKHSDIGTENWEFPQEDGPVVDTTPSESLEESRDYIEEVHGIPEEKSLDYEDTPKDIPEDSVEEVPEMNEEDSAPESAAISPIPDVHHEDDYVHFEDFSEAASENEETYGDDKMATDSLIESIEKESEISHDIPIDITQNEEISEDEEPIPITENELALNNNKDKEEIPEENVVDVQSSGDEHVVEEVLEINEDNTVHEAKEPHDEATETSPVVFSASEDSPEEYVDPVAGAPLPDGVIIHHEQTEHKTSPTKGITHPKADNDPVHPYKLSASDNEVSVPRYLPPKHEQLSITSPRSLTAGSIIGIVVGVIMSLSVVMGVLGFMMYKRRRGHNRPKEMNSDRSYAGSDSGRYINDDQVRVSYANSQFEIPKLEFNTLYYKTATDDNWRRLTAENPYTGMYHS